VGIKQICGRFERHSFKSRVGRFLFIFGVTLTLKLAAAQKSSGFYD
jgi:hypothetical protein